jgi:hypothetical protein
MKTASLFITLLAFCAFGFGGGLESWIEESRRPEDLQNLLDEYHRHPLDLNSATIQQIAELPFFDQQTAASILRLRGQQSGFTSLAEVMKSTTLSEIQSDILRQCATVVEKADRGRSVDVQASGGGARQTRTWWSRQRADLRSSNKVRAIINVTHGEGNPDLLSQTFAGLEFKSTTADTRLLLGDFQCEAGSGLVFATASGQASWLSGGEASAPGDGHGLKLRPSSNRRFLYRGVGVASQRGPLEATLMASVNRRNATTDSSGFAKLTEGENASSETLSAARADQIEERLTGGAVAIVSRLGSLGIAGYHGRWSRPLTWSMTDNERISDVDLGSVYLRLNTAGLSLRSEVAVSNPGDFAHQTALAWRRSGIFLAMYHTFAGANFFSPHSAVWGSFSDEARNERTTGLRIQTTGRKLRLAVHAGISATPFRTESSPLPTHSSFWETRWMIRPARPIQVELLGGRSTHEVGGTAAPTRTVRVDHAKMQTTIHSTIDYEIRYEVRSSRDDQTDARGLGTLLYFQPRFHVLTLDVVPRVTVYNFSGSYVSIQPYEPGLSGHSPVVSLFGTGHRMSLFVSRQWNQFGFGLQVSQSRSEMGGITTDTREAGLQMSYRR